MHSILEVIYGGPGILLYALNVLRGSVLQIADFSFIRIFSFASVTFRSVKV
jgi:hypothetical protein